VVDCNLQENMSQQTPYERLGIDTDASFEEIQVAKQRLQQEHHNDPQSLDNIEAAYDSILMDRLKMRQEGKISVPEGIRFPEKSVQTLSLPKLSPPQISVATNWLGELIEKPQGKDLAVTSGVIASLATIVALPGTAESALPMILAVATGFTLFFLNSKISRLGRAFLITSLGVVGSIVLAMLVINVGHLPIGNLLISGDKIATLFTLAVLWVIGSFIK
jgi:Protein CHAPERONE-LIKE PROTEIN OF POR1-like